jgi:hypothetical protein
MSVKDRYEALAAAWQLAGRSSTGLLSGWELLQLQCWSHSDGAKRQSFSSTLSDYLNASVNAQSADWVEDLCGDRESCRVCGEVYRVENLQLCTDCLDTYCYRCAAAQTSATNGNPSCSCGGELVG